MPNKSLTYFIVYIKMIFVFNIIIFYFFNFARTWSEDKHSYYSY
jgi:hypothetical protein